MIKVQIADDHDVVVQGILSILKDEPDIEVVGLSAPIRSGKDILNLVQQTRPVPDVLLLDANMPNFDLLTALDEFAQHLPKLKVVVVTALQDPQLVRAASKRHAAGYILKEEALSTFLPMAIRDVQAGHLWFSPLANQVLIAHASVETGLSEYQANVLRLMVQGKTPEEIANMLQRSVSAIYNAQYQIREKLGVSTNEAAMIVALRENLVSLKPE